MRAPTLVHTGRNIPDAEWRARVDLAASFRLAVENNWHEAVSNHFSLAVSEDGKKFLMNPRWRHFARIRASDLLLIDADDPETMNRPDAPDPSAWSIHGRIHAQHPHARCILHVHSPYATAMAALADPTILPIDQNTARYYKRVALDPDFGGIADNDAEGQRLADALGTSRRLLLGNHGILIVAPDVGEAFDDLYYFERACQTMVLALSTGRALKIMPPDIAETTARQWEEYWPMARVHFAEARRLLDAAGSDYAE